nr:hypothetical protein MACL_00000832 [Theileria orientalis]
MCVLFQPICQVRFTNVATVRLKVHGERFEIACYKNKVVNWRSGVETDIQEVLQSPYIFTNISKGKLANNNQLMKAFNTTDINKITKQILDKGEFQVSSEERKQILESTFRDIVSILHELTVNPNTGRPLTRTLLENALKSSGFSVSLNEPPKKQALKAVNLLQKKYPESIARCKMRLQINFRLDQYEEVMDFFQNKDIIIEQNTINGSRNSSASCTPIRFDYPSKKSKKGEAEGDNSQESNGPASESGHGEDPKEKMEFILFLCQPSLFREIENFAMNRLEPSGTLQLIALNIKDSSNAPVSTPVRTKNRADNEESDELLLTKVDSLKLSQSDGVELDSDSNKEDLSCPNSQTCVDNVDVGEGAAKEDSADPSHASKRRCLNCNLEFEDNGFYRKHFKSDFHVFNSKRKLQGLAPISQEEYHHLHSNLL